jgi:hypothetical protein
LVLQVEVVEQLVTDRVLSIHLLAHLEEVAVVVLVLLVVDQRLEQTEYQQ